jgi:tetratricopeptide (TPR) repeat protein
MSEDTKEIVPADLVEMDFLEKIAKRLPRDVDTLEALGDLYTRAGRYEDGLAVDRTLAELEPDDMTIWYNLGCSLALLKKRADALKALKRALELGFSDYDWMSRDPDLNSLREDGEFKRLLTRISSPAPKKRLEA